MDFNQIYSTHYNAVLNYLTQMSKDRAVAQELTNDVFIKVYNNLENYDNEQSAINTWIFNIAKNVAIDYHRKAKLPTVSFFNDGGNDDEVDKMDYFVTSAEISKSDPHTELITKESLENIKSKIVSLPKNVRTVCTLFFIHNYKLKEIAERTNKNINTVKGDIFKGRKILQEKLNRI